jgi:hypothetical protein
MDDTCFATRAGGRIGSFTTNGLNRRVFVTAPRAAMRMNVSMNSLSSRNVRSPSGVYGYTASENFG